MGSVDLLAGLKPGIDAHDCDRGCGGIVTFRNGERFRSLCVGPDNDGEIEVRIENGVYKGYTRDGLTCRIAVVDGRKHWVRDPSDGENGRDIVDFIRCDWDDPRVEGLQTEVIP